MMLVVAAFVLLCTTSALDVSWVPTEDGPLPLSKSYREKAMRLCQAINASPKIMDNIDQSKLDSIESMCRRLKDAAAASGGGSFGQIGSSIGGGNNKVLLAIAIIGALIFYGQHQRQWDYNHPGRRSAPIPTPEQQQRARQARIRMLGPKKLTDKQKELLANLKSKKS